MPRVVHDIAENKRTALWAIGLFLAYLPLCFMGPGSDSDSLLVIRTVRQWLATGQYFGWRLNPGYWVHDTISLGIGSIGGITLINICTALATVIGALFLYKILKEDEIPHPRLWATVYALHPIVWVNAASLIDYNWAVSALIIGFWAFRRHRWGIAIAAMGFAVGVRLASFLIFPILIAAELVQRLKGWRQRILVLMAGWVLGGLFYLVRFLDMGFGCLSVNSTWEGDWSLTAYIGRFVYKSIYFWGLPQLLILTILLIISWKARPQIKTPQVQATLWISVGMVLIFHGLFARYPWENEYLLSCFPLAIYWIAHTLGASKKIALAAAITILSYSIISINVLRPDKPNGASTVTAGIWLEPGYVIQDTIERLKTKPKTPTIPHQFRLTHAQPKK